nr:phosphate acyltransferase [Halomonas sp. PR-M31]
MQPVIEAAQNAQKRLVFADGENQEVLHAVQSLVDEKIVRPILLGRPDVILNKISQLGLRLRQDDDIELVDPADTDSQPIYWQKYHALAGRRGVDIPTAKAAVRQNTTILAALMALNGDADGIICGKAGRFQTHLRRLLDIIGPVPGQRVSSLSTLLLPSGPLFLTDCFIGVNPDIDELVSITSSSIEMVQRFGITPRVAFLSHSNFGTSTVESATKMRKAAAILQERFPDLEIDGEMHAMAALNPDNRAPIYQHSTLSGAANLLVFPNLDAANIALDLIRTSANALLVGPFLSGLALPAHILVPQSTARGIFNISTLAVADSARRK